MEGVQVIRIIRQFRIISIADNNQPNMASPLVQELQAELPAPPLKNNRCLNASVLLLIYFIGIGSIVLGTVHLNDCPVEKMLPTGLIVYGGIFMVARFLNCVNDCRSICEEESSEDTLPCLVLLNLLFSMAGFGMFIAVCYYAFSMNPTTNPVDYDLKNYCDYGLYKTSFYGCIIGLIIYALPVVCGCCRVCGLSN